MGICAHVAASRRCAQELDKQRLYVCMVCEQAISLLPPADAARHDCVCFLSDCLFLTLILDDMAK